MSDKLKNSEISRIVNSVIFDEFGSSVITLPISMVIGSYCIGIEISSELLWTDIAEEQIKEIAKKLVLKAKNEYFSALSPGSVVNTCIQIVDETDIDRIMITIYFQQQQEFINEFKAEIDRLYNTIIDNQKSFGVSNIWRL